MSGGDAIALVIVAAALLAADIAAGYWAAMQVIAIWTGSGRTAGDPRREF